MFCGERTHQLLRLLPERDKRHGRQNRNGLIAACHHDVNRQSLLRRRKVDPERASVPGAVARFFRVPIPALFRMDTDHTATVRLVYRELEALTGHLLALAG